MKQLLSFLLILPLIGCKPGLPSDRSSQQIDFFPTGTAKALSQADFDTLSPDERYRVANKLLATFYKGMPVDDFFDLSASLNSQTIKASSFINNTRTALLSDLSTEQQQAVDSVVFGIDANGNAVPNAAKYVFDSQQAKQEPLARIVEYPVSRNMFAVWMAHFLANTILFSPAYEMESTNLNDVQRIMVALERDILAGKTVREIVRSHLPTISRWRVSRSPENHALEAYELYLGLFETEEDSRKGGIACKNFFLTDEDNGYELSQTRFANSDLLIILENYFVTDCDDVYQAIAGHPLLIPRVTEVVVNYLMSENTAAQRLAVVESIVSSGAENFEQIFKGVIFSQEYLLNTERPRSAEESLFSLLARLRWSADTDRGEIDNNIFRNLTSRNFTQLYMNGMGWASMDYKIGRPPAVPMDGLSFANYHKSMRERVFFEGNAYSGADTDHPGEGGLVYKSGTQEALTHLANKPLDQIIDFYFMTALSRRAITAEKTELIRHVVDDRFLARVEADGVTRLVNDNRLDDLGVIVFDYISRLPEFYYFRRMG